MTKFQCWAYKGCGPSANASGFLGSSIDSMQQLRISPSKQPSNSPSLSKTDPHFPPLSSPDRGYSSRTLLAIPRSHTLSKPWSRLIMRPSTSSFFRPPPALYMRTGTNWAARRTEGAATRRAATSVVVRTAGAKAARAATERRAAVLRNIVDVCGKKRRIKSKKEQAKCTGRGGRSN